MKTKGWQERRWVRREEGGEKQILRYAQDDTDWSGTNGEVVSDSSGSWLARRTWGMVARDWRGGKVFYREWSKLGVEWALGALNGEGGWGELAPEY